MSSADPLINPDDVVKAWRRDPQGWTPAGRRWNRRGAAAARLSNLRADPGQNSLAASTAVRQPRFAGRRGTRTRVPDSSQ